MTEQNIAQVAKLESEVRLLRAGVTEIKHLLYVSGISKTEKPLPPTSMVEVSSMDARIDQLTQEVALLKTGLSEIRPYLDGAPKAHQMEAQMEDKGEDESLGLPVDNGPSTRE